MEFIISQKSPVSRVNFKKTTRKAASNLRFAGAEGREFGMRNRRVLTEAAKYTEVHGGEENEEKISRGGAGARRAMNNQ